MAPGLWTRTTSAPMGESPVDWGAGTREALKMLGLGDGAIGLLRLTRRRHRDPARLPSGLPKREDASPSPASSAWVGQFVEKSAGRDPDSMFATRMGAAGGTLGPRLS